MAKKRLKVALIYPEPLPSQKARSVSFVYTAASLAKMDLDVDLFIEKSGTREEIEKIYNVDLSGVCINHIYRRMLCFKSNAIFNFFIKRKIVCYDILYLRHLKTAYAVIKNRKRRQNYKIIYECHELFSETVRSPKSKERLLNYEKFVLENADVVAFVNNTIANSCSKQFNIKNKHTVYNASRFDFDFMPKDFSEISSVYYIGSLYDWKGIGELVTAIYAINNRYDLKFHIIGGPEENLLKMKQDLIVNRLNKNIKLVSFKNFTEIKEILKRQKVFIIPNNPNYIENKFSLPIKLFEYLSSSSLVICSATPPIKEIVTHGYNGFLYDPREPESLIKVFEEIFAMSPEERQKIAFNAWKSSRTFDDRAKELYELFHNVVEKNA